MSALIVGHVAPGSVPGNYFYANGVDPDGGLLPYALIGGEKLGLDNNYRFAVYQDGTVEYAYVDIEAEQAGEAYAFTGVYDPYAVSRAQNPIVTSRDLAARGIDLYSAPRDAHGIPLPPGGYRPVGNPKNGPGGLGDFLGALALTVLSAGVGYVAVAGIAADLAGAAGAVTSGGATAAGVTLAPEAVAATVTPAGLAAEGGALTATGLADVAVTVPELSAADLAAISTSAGGATAAGTTAASIGSAISTAAGKIGTAVATSAVANKVRDALGLGPSAPRPAQGRPAPAPVAPGGDQQLGALAALALGLLLLRAL